MNTRGQITIFIILGIVILATLAVVFYFTGLEERKEFEAARPAVFEVPQEVQPVKDFVEACVERLASDGLRKIGDHGGYVNPTQLIAYPGRSTKGNSVFFAPGSELKTAYWYYMSSDDSCQSGCQFDTERPPLRRADGGGSIEGQLDRHIAKNLQGCLNNFQEFREQGWNVVERNAPQVETTVARDDVFFVTSLPLRVTRDGQSFDIEDFYVSIPLDMHEIYNLATTLTNLQGNASYLESATMTILSSFSAVDEGKLPPFRDGEVGPVTPPKMWVKHDVLQRVKQVLQAYIPVIQVTGVRNYNFVTAPPTERLAEYYQHLYNRQFMIPLEESHPTLEARFSYLDWWEPFFDLNCNGQICRPESFTLAQIFGMSLHKYEFAYDLSFPVLVEIRNPAAFNGQGYSFRFFLEQNLRNSRPIRAESLLAPAPEAQPPSLFCAPNQFTSPELTFEIKDAVSRQLVDDVSIMYLCGTDSCAIGATEEGKLVTSLPRCLNGVLRLTKAGYESKSIPLSTTSLDEERTVVIDDFYELKTINARVRNYVLKKSSKHAQWKYQPAAGLLLPPPAQETTIVLERQTEVWDEPYATVVQLEGPEESSFQIVPGSYQVTITSQLKPDPSLVIPAERRCVKYTKFLFIKGEECYTIPQQSMVFNVTNPFPYGDVTFNWTFRPDDLTGAKAIEFRQFVLGIDSVPQNQRVIEDLNALNLPQVYAAANKDKVRPVIRR